MLQLTLCCCCTRLSVAQTIYTRRHDTPLSNILLDVDDLRVRRSRGLSANSNPQIRNASFHKRPFLSAVTALLCLEPGRYIIRQIGVPREAHVLGDGTAAVGGEVDADGSVRGYRELNVIAGGPFR